MKVKSFVYVIKGGSAVLLRPGDTVPDGVTVTNPDVIEADAKILPAPAPEPEKQDEEKADQPEATETPARKRTSRKAPASE